MCIIFYVGEEELYAVDLKMNQHIDFISVVGNELQYIMRNRPDVVEEMQLRTSQIFGIATTKMLSNMKVGVVGVSGTGSIVVEQLIRLGVV